MTLEFGIEVFGLRPADAKIGDQLPRRGRLEDRLISRGSTIDTHPTPRPAARAASQNVEIISRRSSIPAFPAWCGGRDRNPCSVARSQNTANWNAALSRPASFSDA